MRQSSKKFVAFFIFGIFSLSIASSAFAEASTSERSVTGFFRRLFNWGPKTVANTAQMTGNTLNNTGEKVIAKTGENTAAVLTGDLEKTGNLIGDPIVGSLETSGQAAAETVEAPVKAAEDEEAKP